MIAKCPIGVFDSGYGGLTVLKDFLANPELSKYDYIYLGDNARAPYGGHSKETIMRFSDEAVRFLFNAGARLIVFACYTASSLALRELQEKYIKNPKSKFKDKKILGVIKPIAEKAVLESRKGHIGVVGTAATINSRAFEIELKNQRQSIKVENQACPLLVPLIEEHWHTKPEARMILKKYLRRLKSCNIDTLILGCTHYPLMTQDFKRIMGKNVKVLDSGKIVAESLADYLKRHPEIQTQLTTGKKREFLTTDNIEQFQKFMKKFAGLKIAKTIKVSFSTLL